MKIKNLTAGILALAMGILHADLLDSEATLQLRYGTPTKVDGWKREYEKGPYLIQVTLASDTYLGGAWEGRCIYQNVRRADKKAFFEDEIRRLLPTKEYGGNWRSTGDGNFSSPHGHAYRSPRWLNICIGPNP